MGGEGGGERDGGRGTGGGEVFVTNDFHFLNLSLCMSHDNSSIESFRGSPAFSFSPAPPPPPPPLSCCSELSTEHVALLKPYLPHFLEYLAEMAGSSPSDVVPLVVDSLHLVTQVRGVALIQWYPLRLCDMCDSYHPSFPPFPFTHGSGGPRGHCTVQ